MGASESKSSIKNINNQLVINKTDIDVLNEQNNIAIANTIISNASMSTSIILQNQKVNISNIRAKGDINIGEIRQDQSAFLSFKSLDIKNVTNEASSNILGNMMNELLSKVDNDAITKMLANAESSTKTEALSMPGWASSKSDAENIVNTTLRNESVMKLKNIMANKIENNFTSENVSDCISRVSNSQEITIADISTSDGSINLEGMYQDQAAEIIAECITNNGISNSIFTDLASTFGVTIVDEKKTKTATEQSAVSKSTTETKGVLSGIGNLLSSITSGYFALVGGISFCSSISCCCILILGLLFFMMSRNKDDTIDSDDE